MLQASELHFGPNTEDAARRRFERLYKACRSVSGHFLRAETSSLRKSGWPMTCQITGRWLEADDGVLVYTRLKPLEVMVCDYLTTLGLVVEDVPLVITSGACAFHREADVRMFRQCLKHEAVLIVTDTKTATRLREPLPWEERRGPVSAVYGACEGTKRNLNTAANAA